MNTGDLIVLSIIIFLLAIWVVTAFRKWLNAPPRRFFPLPKKSEKPTGRTVTVLEDHGYEVYAGKHRVPLSVGVDDRKLQSRLYIDYFARLNGQYYVVKENRNRQPFEWTGSHLRDRLLVYALVYEQTAGVLVVDPEERTVRKITFELEEM